MPLCYKGRSIDVVLGNNIVYFGNDRKHTYIHNVCGKSFVTFQKAVYTGLFIMYSGIINIYYMKTVGHLFTKPVQIEGKIQKLFSPQ